MKVGFVIREFWPLMGGLQIHALRLGQEMSKAGVSFRVVTRFVKERPRLEDYFVISEEGGQFWNEGVPTTVLNHRDLQRFLMRPVFRLLWRRWTYPVAIALFNFVFAKKVERALRSVDMIHYFGSGLELLGFAAAKAAKRRGVPFIVQPAIHLGQWGCDAIDFELYRRADLLLTATEVEKKFLIDRGMEESRIVVIHDGADALEPGNAPAFRERHGIQGPMVLFLGRKTVEKGYPLLHEALPMVLQKVPNAFFVFMGPREERDPAVLGSSQSKNHCEIDFATDQVKADALTACDLLCVPSEGESFGLVYAEAALLGKASVARRIPVLQELWGEKAIFMSGEVDGEGKNHLTAQQLAETLIEALLNSELRAEKAKSAHEKSLRFQWSHLQKKFYRFYRDILTKKMG